MQRILVATDGSAHARKALTFATDLARNFEAELVILHVEPELPVSAEELTLLESEYSGELARRAPEVGLGTIAGDEPWSMQTLLQRSEASALARRLLGERLLAGAEEAAHAGGVQRVRTMLVSGDPAGEILSAAESSGVDAIIVGSRGMGELKALLLGSVSHKVTHLAHCTVMIVR